ncbi:class C sortase [Arcanobacterium canis]
MKHVRENTAPKSINPRWIAISVVLLGILVMLYPVVSTNYNNIRQREFAAKYGIQVAQLDDSKKKSALDVAREYNKKLPGVPILDPYLSDVANPASKAYEEYRSQLSATGDIMARVRVPQVGIDLPVRHDTQPDVIGSGAGHLYGTSLPVGGESTHSVLTSHTGLTSATLFDNLKEVRRGDLMFVDVLGKTLAYKVNQIKVVLPDEISDLKAEAGHDYLTLFTCTPYSVNTHRLLVRGERVPFEGAVAEAAKDYSSSFVIQNWMWVLIGGAVVSLFVLAVMVRRERQRTKMRDIV